MTPLNKTGIISSSVLALGVATFAVLLAIEFAVPTLMASFAVCFALLPVPSSGPGYNLGLIFWCATFIPVPLLALRFFRRARAKPRA